MVNNHYRWDFIGLSTDEKPTPATSEKVVDGSTFYCSDNSKLYVWCKDNWYEKTVSGGGGGTSNFNDLTNRPKYNGTDMTSTTDIPEVKTYSPFTGTDGTTAGTSGLVPAPATTDSGKFLKADGTWDAAGGGGGDTVYSSKTTSNSATDGAVYIGNLNASQDEQPDPTATDNHYKYFWALPNNNASVPRDKSVNILGGPASKYSVVLGYGAKDSSLDSAQRNVVIGNNASLASNATSYCVGIGPGAKCNDDFGVAIGSAANAQGTYSVSIGRNAEPSVNKNYTVNLGAYASATRTGEVNVGSGAQNYGYNGTSYRVIGGVHDGQLANDVTTVGQINTLIDAINTALSTNIPHIGANS